MDNFKKYFKSLREKSGAAVSEDELERFALQRKADVVKSLSGAAISEKELEQKIGKILTDNDYNIYLTPISTILS